MNCDMSQRAKNNSATWVKECDESDKGMWIRMLNVNVMNVTIMHTMLHVPRSTITCLGDAKHFWNCAMCCDCRITYIILQNKNSPFTVVCVNCVFIYFGRVLLLLLCTMRFGETTSFILLYMLFVCVLYFISVIRWPLVACIHWTLSTISTGLLLFFCILFHFILSRSHSHDLCQHVRTYGKYFHVSVKILAHWPKRVAYSPPQSIFRQHKTVEAAALPSQKWKKWEHQKFVICV